METSVHRLDDETQRSFPLQNPYSRCFSLGVPVCSHACMCACTPACVCGHALAFLCIVHPHLHVPVGLPVCSCACLCTHTCMCLWACLEWVGLCICV